LCWIIFRSAYHPKRDLALAQFSQTYHRPNRLRETMPTLARINADMGYDFSQNKRGLNVFVQSSMKRRDVDGGNSLTPIPASPESPRSRTWHRYLELGVVERFNPGKFRILTSVILLLGRILHQFPSFFLKITFVGLVRYAGVSSRCRKTRIPDHFPATSRPGKGINLL
jgi:hypothetical protein